MRTACKGSRPWASSGGRPTMRSSLPIYIYVSCVSNGSGHGLLAVMREAGYEPTMRSSWPVSRVSNGSGHGPNCPCRFGGAAISACEKLSSSVLVRSCRRQCLCSRPCENGLQGQQALGQQWRQALAVLAAMQLTAVLPMSFRGCRYQCL